MRGVCEQGRQTAMRRALAEKANLHPGRGHSSAGRKQVLPRYVAIGNYRGKRTSVDVGDYIPLVKKGRVVLDFDVTGELVGVEII